MGTLGRRQDRPPSPGNQPHSGFFPLFLAAENGWAGILGHCSDTKMRSTVKQINQSQGSCDKRNGYQPNRHDPLMKKRLLLGPQLQTSLFVSAEIGIINPIKSSSPFLISAR